MIWSDFEFVIHLACIIKTRILDIIWPCLLIIMIMTWLFEGVLFICALVVSFVARALRASHSGRKWDYKGTNDTTRALQWPQMTLQGHKWHYKGTTMAANDTTRAQINNIPSKSHVIPLLFNAHCFYRRLNNGRSSVVTRIYYKCMIWPK